MLPCMTDDLAGLLRQRGITSVQQILDLPRRTIQSMIGDFPVSRFYQVSEISFMCIIVSSGKHKFALIRGL